MRVRPSPSAAVPHRSQAQALIAAAVVATLAAALPAQRQFDELRRRGLPAAVDNASAYAFGDLDGDGDLDLVVGQDGQNRLYRNDGFGAYVDATASLPARSANTIAVVLGDVDGDGDLDLVCGNGSFAVGYYATAGQQNRLYLNNGAGVFTDATAAQMPAVADPTGAVVLGDIDGDGDLDLVVGNSFLSYLAGSYPKYYGRYVGQQNRLYLNNGSGTFTDVTAAQMPVDTDFTYAMVLGDVDGDADLDLVIGNGGYSGSPSRLYLNNGSGTFTGAPLPLPQSLSVALGDVDGDNDLDLVLGQGQQNRLYQNNGSGGFSDVTAGRMPLDADATRAVRLGDLDGDGDLDLAVTKDGQSRLQLNNGAGTFTDVTALRLPVDPKPAAALALGDVDGDGALDLVLGNQGQQSRLYLNNANGVFADATASPWASAPVAFAVATGDVDGDGDLDVVTGGYGERNRLYLNDGSGSLVDVSAVQMPVDTDRTQAVALGDVDGDGDLDLVMGNSGGGIGQQNRLYLNSGGGVFTDVTATRLPVGAQSTTTVALADVDGDGDLDLVCGNGGSPGQQNQLYLNNGGGVFTDGTAGRLPIAGNLTVAVVAGDVDGDGDLDLIFGNGWPTAVAVRLLQNNGNGVFTDISATHLPAGGAASSTFALALGDIDGDGDLDLAIGSFVRSQNRLYRNDGSGRFTDVTASQLPVDADDTVAAVFGDVDGDGDLDLVFGSQRREQSRRLYLNDGTGTFRDVTAVRLPDADASVQAAVLADVDGDSDLDLVTAGQPSRLYRNLLRQLGAPRLLRVGQPWTVEAHARYGPPHLVDLVLPFVALAPAAVPMPPYGTVGIDPNSMVGLPLFVVPQPAGVASVSLSVPNNPGLVGLGLYAQALLIQDPVQFLLTNVVRDTVR